ncbi:hypothetical protein Tco_0366650 [Tanacetum coccineum]
MLRKYSRNRLKFVTNVKYRDNGSKCSKSVDVEYSWKPPIIIKCLEFGHVDGRCSKQSNGVYVVGDKEQGNMDNRQFKNNFNRARESNGNNVVANKNGEKRDA